MPGARDALEVLELGFTAKTLSVRADLPDPHFGHSIFWGEFADRTSFSNRCSHDSQTYS
jgi:hypothetical protein